MPEAQARVAIALGSNLGPRHRHIRAAARLLSLRGVEDLRLSSLLETSPVDCTPDAPDFVNAAVTGRSSLSPHELLELCLRIEEELGRPRERGYNEARSIDLDLLLHEDQVIDSSALTLPHPRMLDRTFVLQPLAEIAGDWEIPGQGKVNECLRKLESSS